jgi:hypothetical protein
VGSFSRHHGPLLYPVEIIRTHYRCFVQLDDEGKSVQAIRFDPKARVGGFGE